MSLTIRCSACQATLRVGDDLLGKKVRCPKCRAVIVVESAEEPPVAEIVEDDEGFTERAPPRPRPQERARRRPRWEDEAEDEPENRYDRAQPMPTSVRLAVVALCVLFSVELVMAIVVLGLARLPPPQLGRVIGQMIAAVVIGGLVLSGLLVGHRLAWQWGRLLGMLGAVIYLLAGILVASSGLPEADTVAARVVVGAFALVVSSCLFTIAISLGTASARNYFDLRCPACGKFTNAAADFFFNNAKCKNCGKIW